MKIANVRKGDLREYVTKLYARKKKQIVEKYDSILRDEELKEQAVSHALRNVKELDKKNKAFRIEVEKQKASNSYVEISIDSCYSKRNAIRDLHFNMENDIRKSIHFQFSTSSLGSSENPIFEDDKGTPMELVKKRFNELSEEYKKEISEIKQLTAELEQIITLATRGSDAYNKLKEVGLDLTEFNAFIMRGANTALPVVLTNVNVKLFDGLSEGNEKKDAEA